MRLRFVRYLMATLYSQHYTSFFRYYLATAKLDRLTEMNIPIEVLHIAEAIVTAVAGGVLTDAFLKNAST